MGHDSSVTPQSPHPIWRRATPRPDRSFDDDTDDSPLRLLASRGRGHPSSRDTDDSSTRRGRERERERERGRDDDDDDDDGDRWIIVIGVFERLARASSLVDDGTDAPSRARARVRTRGALRPRIAPGHARRALDGCLGDDLQTQVRRARGGKKAKKAKKRTRGHDRSRGVTRGHDPSSAPWISMTTV